MQTFNEFFIRELKPGARPIACIERDDVAICAADSRLMAFINVEDSQRFWIKVHLLPCSFQMIFTTFSCFRLVEKIHRPTNVRRINS